MNKQKLPKISANDDFSADALLQRNRFLSELTGADLSTLTRCNDVGRYRGNIENICGFIQLPVGIAGPLWLRGDHANGEFHIPLATTEGTLVASYNRGMKAISQSGGAVAHLTQNEIFSSLTVLAGTPDSARIVMEWIKNNEGAIRNAAEATTKHGKFLRAEATLYGSRVLVNLFYDPGDAMGINMITSASYAAAQVISQANGDVDFLLPSAFQGDKKASYYSFSRGRGRSVEATAIISERVIHETLKTTGEAIYRNYLNNIETAHLAGGYGFNMHIANGITALGLATGQDVAYVGESANSHLIVERQKNGLLFSLRIPSLYVGTVGGGTSLPTHKPCLEMLGCIGKGSAPKLAEIFAGVCLAGEISVLAAIASHQFVRAHELHGRNRPIGQ